MRPPNYKIAPRPSPLATVLTTAIVNKQLPIPPHAPLDDSTEAINETKNAIADDLYYA